MNHYVIVTSAAQPEQATVWTFKNARYAEAVAANQSKVEGVTAVIATDEEKDGQIVGLALVPTATLVVLYNIIRPEKPIKKFADRETAEKRLKGVLEVLAKPGEAPTQDALDEAASSHTAQEGDTDMATKTKGRKRSAKSATTKKKAAATTGEAAGRPSAFAGKVLRKVATDNPRREGTHGYNSWEHIKNGMTYEKYIEAGGRRQDLAWDLAHGFVKVEKA